MSRSIEFLIEDILGESMFIIENSDISEEAFMYDEIIKRAFVRSLEIIGEASKKLPKEFKSNNHSIHWNKMAGMRNLIVHDYTGIDYSIVWDVIKTDIPQLIDKLSNLKF